MSVQLSNASLKKLTCESVEIRLRTLDQVEAKFRRALAHNEQIEFKPGKLCKQLIRWFGYEPLQQPLKVLQLLTQIVSSKYGKRAIQDLSGLARFRREVEKIQHILRKSSSMEIELQALKQLQQQLSRHEGEGDADEIIEIFDALSLSDGATDSARAFTISTEPECYIIQCPPVDYEAAWSKPTVADFNSLKMMADILVNPYATTMELQTSLHHLQITMLDYPAEYMLQAPHIYTNLLQLFERADELKCPLDDVTGTLMVFLRCLRERLQMRRRCLNYATPPSGSSENLLGRTQLKLEKALKLLIEKCIAQLQMLLTEFCSEIVQVFCLIRATMEIYEMLHLCIDAGIMKKLNSIADNLKQSCEQAERITLPRIHHLIITFLLQDIIENNAKRQPLLEFEELTTLLFSDYTLECNFPERYRRLQGLLFTADATLQEKYELYKNYRCYLSTSITLLKSPTSKQIANHSHNISGNVALICLALSKLQSCKLTSLLFDSIVACNTLYPTQPNLKQQASDLLLKLMQLESLTQRAMVYQLFAKTVKKHFAALMNCENFCAGMPNDKLLAEQIIGVPISAAILRQLINECFESSDAQIKANCESILTLLLQSQHLLGEHWECFLELLQPVLPLMLCCTFSDKLMTLLFKLYDPDAHNLPFLSVLRGNICLLFHADIQVRGEALTRLIYMMNSLKNADDYVPNIMEVSDLIPNDLCLLQVPREFARIFATSEAYAELTTILNLCSILETQDIEPLIRKTTLMQLNVMCQNWQMATAFCEESAIYLALQALENSLQKCSYADYTDAAIPAIGILCKALFCDASLREKLASTANIYVLLLRALFLYQNDIQVRQDASVCLFLLIYSNFLVVLPSMCLVEVPGIVGNMQLPLKCELRAQTIHVPNKYAVQIMEIFKHAPEEISFLRQFIAAAIVGSYADINFNKNLIAQLESHDYCSELHLTQRDWRLMKASMPAQNMRRFLRAIANATDHKALLDAITMLKLQLLLNDLAAASPDAFCSSDLFKLLGKYLQLPPGNDADYLVFEKLLELFDLCVHLKHRGIIDELTKVLQLDYQHAFIVLLYNAEIPLRLYYKLCQLWAHLLCTTQPSKSFDKSTTTSGIALLHSYMFEMLYEIAMKFFERRDLARVRCVLMLLELLSDQHLDLEDEKLRQYCKSFITLSISLKASTQTGAHWQRMCLRTICQLYTQMSEPQQSFKLNIMVPKYLSSLGGHIDLQVRALAWCVLAQLVRSTSVQGTAEIVNELAYLPGGFLACCLSTLLDYSEALLIRQLAGQLFSVLLSKISNFEEGFMLLQQQSYFRTVDEALSSIVLNSKLPRHFDYAVSAQLNSCEIVSCFCRICIEMLALQPSFLQQLCEQAFMFKLCDLLKMPTPTDNNNAYFQMCADICELYAHCRSDNFLFLQRTLCRDQIWLMSFCQLLAQPELPDTALVNVLQLLLALCNDDSAFERLCEKFANEPQYLIKLLLSAFIISNISTSLQRCALAVLSMLLIKSQSELKLEHKSFAQIIEQPIENLETTSTETVEENNNKENVCRNANKNEKVPTNSLKAAVALTASKKLTNFQANVIDTTTHTAAALLFVELFRLWSHLYPLKACKFDAPPSAAKQQVSETLALMLKLSPQAQEAAKNLKLLDKILQIFQSFHEEFNTSCTTFVRRYGENKKMAIIKNFQVLFSILLNWFTAPTSLLADERQASELTKLIIQTWAWHVHSAELKQLVLQLCSFVSERSLIVCQNFATVNSSSANSVLQLVLKCVNHETTKVKAASSENLPIIRAALRTVMNCCACAEGRVSLIKSRTLDIFDGIHPFNLKAPKLKVEIVYAWLQFWELFSRYAEGAPLRNLNSLCAVINRAPPRSTTRLYALKILRNMSFLPANRSPLLASPDFIYTVNEVISQSMPAADETVSYAEQMMVSVAMWKLISGGVKYVAMIRATKLAKKFRILREQLTALEEEQHSKLQEFPFALDLTNVLDVIFAIFNE